jgi:2-haloacid dehalogenase
MECFGNFGERPDWLTFDCYGTLIQWDEGLVTAVQRILSGKAGGHVVSTAELILVYDRFEHQLKAERPHRRFREVAGLSLSLAMRELGLPFSEADVDIFTRGISAMPPFPDVVPALSQLKRMGFRTCIVSNTDDDIIAGNVAQLGGTIDRVISAEQAQAYKPSRQIFEHAHAQLGIERQSALHICASPQLDLQAARDIGFRCIWIDRNTGRRSLDDYTPDAILPKLDRVPVLFKQLGW